MPVHRNQQKGNPVTNLVASEPAEGHVESEPVVVSEAEFKGEGEQIRYYLGQHYTGEQLIYQFGFNPDAVRKEVAKWVPPEDKPETKSTASTSLV
jgi:hypothetical protein